MINSLNDMSYQYEHINFSIDFPVSLALTFDVELVRCGVDFVHFLDGSLEEKRSNLFGKIIRQSFTQNHKRNPSID